LDGRSVVAGAHCSFCGHELPLGEKAAVQTVLNYLFCNEAKLVEESNAPSNVLGTRR
jgi:hypothetical protein